MPMNGGKGTMPKEKLSMRKLSEVLRLNAADLSHRQIAKSCGISRSTVSVYLKRAASAGLCWPLDPEMTEADLARLLFANAHPGKRSRDATRPVPDWARVHKELKRKGVTLKLLWDEYRQHHPKGYLYSQFCEHYRRWSKTADIPLRQTYRGGERMFVDYAGLTMPVYDSATRTVRNAHVFVAALGASHYLYAEATYNQQLPNWIASHVRAYEYFQGVPAITVPDNLKSGVSKACHYDPDINPTYQDMAAHYGSAIIPARLRRPRDKSKAEVGVQIVEQEVLAPLRDRTFFSLAELNRAIFERLEQVNIRPFQKLPQSRYDLYLELDRPALKPLPPSRYEYAEILKARVNIDYHIEVRGHYYSVPFKLRREQVDVRLGARMVEVLHNGCRVAAHLRSEQKGRHTTDKRHMPKAHQKYLEWSPSRIIEWARKIGPDCAQAVEHIIENRPHPEQGYRASLGIIRLAKRYTDQRVNAACRRALQLNVCQYRSIQSILKNNLDQEALPDIHAVSAPCAKHHQNVRGAAYYAGKQAQEKEMNSC